MVRRFRPYVLLACGGFIGLVACTPLEWRNSASAGAATDADLEQCRQEAFLNASREAWLRWRSMSTLIVRDRSGRLRLFDPWPLQMNDTFMREAELQNFCMRLKGYHLAPVE